MIMGYLCRRMLIWSSSSLFSHWNLVSSQYYRSTRKVFQRNSSCLRLNDVLSTIKFLSHKDLFIGVAPSKGAGFNAYPGPEVAITCLKEYVAKYYRVNPMSYIDILMQFELENVSMLNMLKRSPENVLTLIQICGRYLPQFTPCDRLSLFNWLWSEFHRHDFPVSTSTYNNVLLIYLENNHIFDVWQVLKEMTEKCLKPGAETFHYLFEYASVKEDSMTMKRLIDEIENYGIALDSRMFASIVRCSSRYSTAEEVNDLLMEANERFGDDGKALANVGVLLAAASEADIPKLMKILDESLVQIESLEATKRYSFSYSVIYEALRLMIACPKFSSKTSNLHLIDEILENTLKQPGYFRYCFCESLHYICCKRYDVSVQIFGDIVDCKSGRREFDHVLMTEYMSYLSRELILNNVPLPKLKRLAIYFSEVAGIENRFCDFIIFSSLAYRDLSAKKKIALLMEFIDLLDPGRDRIHIILPYIAKLTLTEKLEILERFIAAGYDLSSLKSDLLERYILKPFIEETSEKLCITTVSAAFDKLLTFLHECTERNVVWKIVADWDRLVQKRILRREDPLDAVLSKLLKRSLDVQLKAERVDNTNTNISASFMDLVRKGNLSDIDNFILSHGLPSGTRDDSFQALLDIYLRNGGFIQLNRFLMKLSKNCRDSRQLTVLKNFHIIKILEKHIIEYQDIANTTQLCNSLHELFPNAVYDHHFYYDTMVECTSLLKNFFKRSQHEIVPENVKKIMQLLKTMVNNGLIEFHDEENISTIIAKNVLERLGWNEALRSWLQFNALFDSSNAIIFLLSRACENKRHDIIKYIIDRGKHQMSRSRFNAIFAYFLVLQNKLKLADSFFLKTEISSFDVLCAFRLITSLNYKKPDVDVALDYVKLCLKHTDLQKNEVHCQQLYDKYLKISERLRAGKRVIDLYIMLRDAGVKLDHKSLQKALMASMQYTLLANKWMYDDHCRLLNAKKFEDFIRIEKAIDEIKEDLK